MANQRRTTERLVRVLNVVSLPAVDEFQPSFSEIVGIQVECTTTKLPAGSSRAVAQVTITQGKNRYVTTVYRDDLSDDMYQGCRMCKVNWKVDCRKKMRITVKRISVGGFVTKVYLNVKK